MSLLHKKLYLYNIKYYSFYNFINKFYELILLLYSMLISNYFDGMPM